MKNTYKCAECKTSIIINTKVHELPESIICPCESVMPLDSSK
jgi:DNA-directed RNA polymerase subunit RPC12/RpoP